MRRSQCRVRDQHHCTSGVSVSESHQFVSVASWLKFLRGTTCALHAWWTLALCARGHWNRVFLRWPALQLGQGRALEDRSACSETAEVSAQFTLEQDEHRVWWYAAWWTLFALAGGLLCGGFAAGAISVAWWHRFTCRPEHPFVREAIPLLVNSPALTPSLRNSIRRALKEATQKRLTNGSPSATQCVLLGCASRGSWMHRNRRANDAGWRRGRWPLQSCNIWDARRCCSGALLRTRLSQRRQRGLCCRELAGTDGRLVGPPRAARGDTCGLVGFDDGGRLPLPAQLLEVSQAQPQAILSLRRSHRAFRWKESSKRPGLSRASRPSTPKAARRSPANVFQELVVDHLEELSGRLSQPETTEKGAFASAIAQLGFSQKARRSSIAGGLTVPSVLGRSATSLSGPAACARARALLGSGCTIRSPPSCQITDRAGRHRVRSPILRSKLPVSAVPSCVSRAHWSRSTILVGQFTTLLDKTRESQTHRRSTMPSLGTGPLASLLDLPGSEVRR